MLAAVLTTLLILCFLALVAIALPGAFLTIATAIAAALALSLVFGFCALLALVAGALLYVCGLFAPHVDGGRKWAADTLRRGLRELGDRGRA